MNGVRGVIELVVLVWIALHSGAIAYQLRRIARVNETYAITPREVGESLLALATEVEEFLQDEPEVGVPKAVGALRASAKLARALGATVTDT